METIVLDYADGNVHIIDHDQSMQIEEMEELLCDKYNFRLDEIEWMTVDDIDFTYHSEPKTIKGQFVITGDEISELLDEDISEAQMNEILSYIENDKGVWEAIEIAKKNAISHFIDKK